MVEHITNCINMNHYCKFQNCTTNEKKQRTEKIEKKQRTEKITTEGDGHVGEDQHCINMVYLMTIQ